VLLLQRRLLLLLLLAACAVTALRPAKPDKRWRGSTRPPRDSVLQVRKTRTQKFTVRVGDTEKELLKKRGETLEHVLTKALIWALYDDAYPSIDIERDIGDETLKVPDCIAFDQQDAPVFWGESGRMSAAKAVDIATRYPGTHFVNVRWNVDLDTYSEPLLKALRAEAPTRSAPFEFGALAGDPRDYVDPTDGSLRICRDDVVWTQL